LDYSVQVHFAFLKPNSMSHRKQRQLNSGTFSCTILIFATVLYGHFTLDVLTATN